MCSKHFNHRCILVFCFLPSFISRVPSPQGLMSDDLRWSWCNSNRNKVHHKWNVLESSQPTPSLWKNCLPQNWSLVPKRLGTAALYFFPNQVTIDSVFKVYLKSTYFSPALCHPPVLVTWVTSVTLCVYWDSFPSSWNANLLFLLPPKNPTQNKTGEQAGITQLFHNVP